MARQEQVVIVGGGMAGARLARHLGAAPGGGPAVTVLAEEPHPAYNRVLLADVLARRYPAEVIALPRPAESVSWRAGTRVARIDRAARRVVCEDGAEVAYDTLVLATGASAVLPPLVRAGAPGLPERVYAFRTLDDCLALDRALTESAAVPESVAGHGSATGPGSTAGHGSAAVPGAPRAVVIGGGLLGVLAAQALTRRGARVVLAHQGEHLMERQLDRGAAALLRAHLTASGVEVHTECRARRLHSAPGDPAAKAPAVTAVELADGYRLDADLVVLACGVRPRAGLARAAGLDLGPHGGVAVDDRLATSDPAVHAIGDCAEHGGLLYGLAQPAQDQADVLAGLLTTRPGARYRGTRALVRLTLHEGTPREGTPREGTHEGTPREGPLDLAAFGRTTPMPGDDVVHLADGTRGAYRKLVVRGDRLRGGILLGDLGSVGTLAGTWEADQPLPATAPLLHLLTHDGGY
ncbi:NAD(P)/FAD-dependent oxidoreductase [Streptomyces hoynatensis]|uniref:NAD(P)/FAD-dependent oxidoreductase n=1 Tax=Streptomyces hoynatensis TaxID=1141874 RepID=A0A3A9ZEN3_9ACTN|nr:FAD-dependent oxidoreductase [Streptomyces hoynatensis]RKN45726.1 NAD(P)/FAD-dependent oxidoreductase [Streptomyces hoynatensis]